MLHCIQFKLPPSEKPKEGYCRAGKDTDVVDQCGKQDIGLDEPLAWLSQQGFSCVLNESSPWQSYLYCWGGSAPRHSAGRGEGVAQK